ncbi:type I polyketide synthase [Saccharothrix xinjiangensis]|uniref:Beta-ketoacyl synthase N-terminal-like domain-containing protein n=1 Tax=Saccharothrix xinjiangensis TaxID=204798 RepID=A0ABV9YGC1_9PSEU
MSGARAAGGERAEGTAGMGTADTGWSAETAGEEWAEGAIAVVGAACRFPGAPDVDAYRRVLRAGADALTRFGPDELRAAGVPEELLRDPAYVPVGGVLPGGELFDRSWFGYSPAEARTIDPQHRVLLEVAVHALDHAGLDPERFPGWVGVFAGCDAAPVPHDFADPAVMSSLVGTEKDFLASRVAYKLGLRGPALTVQTACSTSLVAVHVAGQSLLNHECDAALAGGVSLRLPQARGYLHQEGHIFSRDGRCRSFDAGATGTVPSAGAGLVVLRRLVDAVRDGDRVLAVIRGSALTNDGGEKIGYTAPSVPGQRDAILLALGQSGVDPGDVAHVEAHGTGTEVGDAVEVAALTEAFRHGTDRTGFCALSSVKGNIGHTGSAAGVAGLIKSVLLLRHGEVVPQAHLRRPNPRLDLDRSPFRLVDAVGPLGGRLVAVSSFGIGGTNAHAVLEAAPSRPRGAGPAVFALSARTAGALDRARRELADHLAERRPEPAEVAWTLLCGRRRSAHRFTVPGDDLDAAVAELRDRGRAPAVAPDGPPRVAFLFPGQGALHAGAASAAHEALPVFREHLDHAIALARRDFGVELGAVLDGDVDDAPLRTGLGQQLGLFGIGFALGGQFLAWGVRPVAVLGHSAGEYAAAAVAGAWDLAAGLRVVGERALAMRDAPPGALLAAYAPPEVLAPHLAARPVLAVATFGPGQTVLAGPAPELDDLVRALTAEDVRTAPVESDRAFHTPAMRPAGDRLAAAVAASAPRPPELPVISNLTGEPVDPDRVPDPAYWVEHLTSPVRLTEGMGALLRDGCDVAVELGPGATVVGGLRRHERYRDDVAAVPLLGGRREDRRAALHRALGALWAAGVELPWAELFPVPAVTDLPGTPLEPEPVPPPVVPTGPAPVVAAPVEASGLTTRRWIDTGTRAPAGEPVVLTADHPAARVAAGLLAGDGEVVGLPGDPAGAPLADRLAAAVPRGGIAVHGVDGADLAGLDEVAAHARAAGVRLVLAVSGDPALPDEGRRDLLAWVAHRRRAGRDTALLDLGAEGAPARPPRADPDCAAHAWRAGRWWALTAAPEPVPGGAGEPGPVVVAGDDPGAALTAAHAWSAAGVPVAATVDLRSAPAREELPALAGDLEWTRRPSLSGRPDLLAAVEDCAAAHVVRLLVDRGLLAIGAPVPAAALVAGLDPAGRLPRLAERVVRAPVERGLLVAGDGGLLLTEDAAARVEAAPADGRLAEARGLAELIAHCVRSYPAVFAGETAPHAVLYQDGSDERIARLLADNRVALTDEQACLDALAGAVARLGAGRDRPLRVLEVGGGRGDLTWRVVDRLGVDAEVDYAFTDVSGLQVRKAERQAAERGVGWLRGARCDITADPVAQGFAAGGYDVVLGFNVVHVAPDVAVALTRLGRLLRPDGLLALVELTSAALWTHLVYGLLPGWWDYADDLRADSLHLDADGWRRAARRAGLDCEVASADAGADHAVVLARPAGEPSPEAELTRQLGDDRPAAVLYLASGAAAGAWPGFCAAVRERGARRAVVLTEDPGDWRAELLRDRLDPPDGEVAPWHHLRVAAFDRRVLAGLPRLLTAADLPRSARWTPPPDAPEDSGGAPRAVEAPAAGGAGVNGTGVNGTGVNGTGVNGTALTAGPAAAAPTGVPAVGAATTAATAPIVATPATSAPTTAAAVPATTAPATTTPATDRRAVLARLWCENLGVGAVRDEDDFFVAGGESLALVHLLGEVHRNLGARVETSRFAPTPTFGRLVELVAERAPRADGPVPNLLPLSEGGDGTPLLLCAPATGSSLCYRHVAPLIGRDRPVLGLDVPADHPGGGVRGIAAGHAALVRQVQPEGPYLLGGWSAGFAVAHELAAQLEATGARVRLLVSFDGLLPDTKGRPMGLRPEQALRAVALLAGARLGRSAPLDRTLGLAGRSRVPRIDRIAAVLPDGHELVRSHNRAVRAVLAYRPRPVRAPAVVLKTGVDDTGARRLAARSARLYPGGIEVVAAPGDHWGVLDAEPAAVTADLVLGAFDRYGV